MIYYTSREYPSQERGDIVNFRYGNIETEYLKSKDPRLAEVIEKAVANEFDLDAVAQMPDEDAIKALSSLKGIGVWTAEMILLFCLQRPNIFSYGDLAILRGIRMVYHHRKIDQKLFEKYRRRFSPYCSVASLYFWAVGGGAVPGMKDYAPKKKKG